jgi:hypothetical protein
MLGTYITTIVFDTFIKSAFTAVASRICRCDGIVNYLVPGMRYSSILLRYNDSGLSPIRMYDVSLSDDGKVLKYSVMLVLHKSGLKIC